MTQFPQQPPLNYMTPGAIPPRKFGGKRWIGWVLFVALAAFLFLMMSRQSPDAAQAAVPLSQFQSYLRADAISSVVVERNQLRCQLGSPRAFAGRNVTAFTTELPEGLSSNWQFIQWLLDNRRGAEVSVRNGDNVALNILLPLVPWLLIFGFLWYSVFRHLRAGGRPAPIMVSGPGRWVPDEPGKVGPG